MFPASIYTIFLHMFMVNVLILCKTYLNSMVIFVFRYNVGEFVTSIILIIACVCCKRKIKVITQIFTV